MNWLKGSFVQKFTFAEEAMDKVIGRCLRFPRTVGSMVYTG